MNWNKLEGIGSIDDIIIQSEKSAILIFKHSTRCSISAMAMDRLERHWELMKVDPYLLDVIQFRKLSDEIALRFKVKHESPQVILLTKGKVIYHASHMAISYQSIKEHFTIGDPIELK